MTSESLLTQRNRLALATRASAKPELPILAHLQQCDQA